MLVDDILPWMISSQHGRQLLLVNLLLYLRVQKMDLIMSIIMIWIVIMMVCLSRQDLREMQPVRMLRLVFIRLELLVNFLISICLMMIIVVYIFNLIILIIILFQMNIHLWIDHINNFALLISDDLYSGNQ